MPLILAIETSSVSGSVALLENDVILGVQYYNIDKSHSSLLHVMIEQLMGNTQRELNQLDAVAIAEGPGSYTGLRIGASTAKGLCYSLDLPLISINTLEGMAYQVYRYNKSTDYYCPMLDARRMEVYTMLVTNKFEIERVTEPVILDEQSYVEELKNSRILFFGDGASKFKETIDLENAIFIDGINPSAVDIALLAVKKYNSSTFENVITFEPFYLKEFRIASPKK